MTVTYLILSTNKSGVEPAFPTWICKAAEDHDSWQKGKGCQSPTQPGVKDCHPSPAS